METINRECYVSLEVAKLLKQAGFDWPTHYSYDLYLYSTEGEKRVIDGFAPTFCNEHNGLASMPTLEVAQRWLREVKGIHICVKADAASINCKYFVAVIISDTKWGNVQDENKKSILFNTYEEAQEAGIKKALEIILEKEE